MRILVLGSSETLLQEPDYYTNYVALAQAATPKDSEVAVTHAFFDDLFISIGNGVFTIRNLKDDRDLNDYSLIMMRGRSFKKYMDVLKTVSVYANQHSVALINDYSGYRSGSKLDQAVRFHTEQITSPLTVVVTAGLVTSGRDASGLTFPCIMKATLGAHGADNHVVKNWEEIVSIQTANPDLRYILQEFIVNDGDYRLLIIGENMLAIHRQAKSGSHLNNTSQGGQANLIETTTLPASLIVDAKRLAKNMDFTAAGVDVLKRRGSEEYYFLEVNSQPQLMSGAFLEAKTELFAQYLRSLQV